MKDVDRAASIVPLVVEFGFLTAVLSAITLAVTLGFLCQRGELVCTLPHATERAAAGSLVATTTATAGIIVGVFTLTGLGLKMSDLIVDLARGQLFMTVVLTALAVWILGLAVPVTASYIIAAVITAPAMISLGVPEVAAHMFIFYYAVLSEVSPPTALAPFAAAITGGSPFKTMMVTWKYTLPAFIVPFMFTVNSETGTQLLAIGDPFAVVLSTVTACLAIVALVLGVGGWIIQPATWLERALLIPAAGLLLYTGPVQDIAGLAPLAAAFAIHVVRIRGSTPTLSPST